MISDQRKLGCVAFRENIEFPSGHGSFVPWKTITVTIVWNLAWVCALLWIVLKVLDQN